MNNRRINTFPNFSFSSEYINKCIEDCKNGFTLAEVLTTLTVIGIVAALTIPGLLTNFQNSQYATAMKKKYAESIEMVKRAELANDETAFYWDWTLNTKEFVQKYLLPSIQANQCSNCWLTTTENISLFFLFEQPAYAASAPGAEFITDDEAIACFAYNTPISKGASNLCPSLINDCTNNFHSEAYTVTSWDIICQNYLAGVYSSIPQDNPDSNTVYSMSDGSTLGFYKTTNNKILYLYFDVNGRKAPNKYGKDRYVMMLSGSTLTFYGEGETNLTEGTYGCSDSGNNMFCGALLKKNNWKL